MYASPGSVVVSESDADIAILFQSGMTLTKQQILTNKNNTLPDPSRPPTGEPSGRASVLLNVVRVMRANDTMLIKRIIAAGFGPVN